MWSVDDLFVCLFFIIFIFIIIRERKKERERERERDLVSLLIQAHTNDLRVPLLTSHRSKEREREKTREKDTRKRF